MSLQHIFSCPSKFSRVGTSLLSALDVSLIYSTFWTFTSAISLLALICLAGEFTQQRRAALCMACLVIFIAIFDPNVFTYELGIGIPFPNRYGFAAGVLLPLNLVMVCSIIRQRFSKKVNIALLIYLTIEMTFVHARETVLLLSCVATFFLLLLSQWKANKSMLWCLAGVLATTGLILIGYKNLTTWASQDVAAVLALWKEQTHQALISLINQHGTIGSTFATGPESITYHLGRFGAVLHTHVPSYQNIFVYIWTNAQWISSARIVLPFTLVCLPFYALRTRSVMESTFAWCLTGAALLSMSGLAKFGISYLTGNPEVLAFQNLVYILTLCVWAHMVSLAAARILEQDGGWKWGTTMVFMLLITNGICSATLHMNIVTAVATGLAFIWQPEFALVLHGATAIILLFFTSRQMESLVPNLRQPELRTPASILCAAFFVLLPALPALGNPQTWLATILHFQNPPSKFKGQFTDDYARLVASGKLPSDLPVGVIRYLREKTAPNQTILCLDAMSVLEATDHFAAIVTDRRQQEIPGSYICNWTYLTKYEVQPGPFRFSVFVTDPANFGTLNRMLRELEVGLVLTPPEETSAVNKAIDERSELKRVLRLVHVSDGYAVYAVGDKARVYLETQHRDRLP